MRKLGCQIERNETIEFPHFELPNYLVLHFRSLSKVK